MEHTLSNPIQQADAFSTLLDANRGRLERIARRYADAVDVPDLLQEMALQAWRSRHGFQGRASADTWLYRVALNTACSWLRKKRPARPLGAMDVPTTAGDPVDEMTMLSAFLEQLDPVNRSVLILYMEGLGAEAIGEIVGLRRNAVAVRLTRLKARFEDTYLGDAE